MHSNMNINMDANKLVHSKQTNNEQTNKDVWAFKKRTLNHLISHNVHHINHNKGIKIKWQGIDLHRFSFLLSQRSLISSVFIDFNDMTRAQYRVDDPSACTTAWHRILMLLMSWPAENKRHNSTQKNMFFMDTSWPLHGVHFAAFQLRPYPIFRNTALSLKEKS